MKDRVVALITEALQPRRGMAWHGGPTPSRALRGVDARLAHRRPPGGGHSIWEIALHIAYWDYIVRRRLLRGVLPRFPRGPANWPMMPPKPDPAAWEADRDLLALQHGLLAEVVERFPPKLLGRRMTAGKRWTYGDTILGITIHDAYHAGQIQLLKRIGRRR